MKKYFRLLLASCLTLSSFSSPAIARPILVNGAVEVTLGGDGEAGGVKGSDGKFRCQWGCGEHTSPDGGGWGNGDSRGKGSPPSIDHGSSSDGGTSSGSNRSNEDGYFGGFDRYNGEKKEYVAWKEYNDMVAKLNDQWGGEINQRYQAEKDDLSLSENSMDQITVPLSNELETNTSASKDFETLLSQNIPVQINGYRYLVNDRLELKPLLDYEYQSAQKDELEKIREPVSNFKPNSPQSYYAYKAGLQALKQADQSYLQNEIEVGNFLKESAKILFDVATDLIPITSIPKDLYRTFVGKDPLTGRELVPFERVLAGGFVVFASVTLGGSNLLKNGMKSLMNITGATVKEIEVATEIITAAEKIGITSSKVANELIKISKQIMGADKDGLKMIQKLAEESKSVSPVLGDRYVRKLPELKNTLKEAFDGIALQGEYRPGEVVFQAQRRGQTNVGHWFLPVKPMDSQHAESLANIAKWGNDADQIKAFVFTERVSGYAGKVAGGEGHQFFIPPDVPLKDVLKEVKF